MIKIDEAIETYMQVYVRDEEKDEPMKAKIYTKGLQFRFIYTHCKLYVLRGTYAHDAYKIKPAYEKTVFEERRLATLHFTRSFRLSREVEQLALLYLCHQHRRFVINLTSLYGLELLPSNVKITLDPPLRVACSISRIR